MSERRSVGLGLGALLPAFAVTATWFCCLPLALGGLGAGAVVVGTALTPVRPYFVGLSVVFLGLAFYNAYKPSAAVCGPDAGCSVSTNRGRQRILLWIIAIASLAFMTVERWGSWVIFWML